MLPVINNVQRLNIFFILLLPVWLEAQSYTYSNNADFTQGTLVGVECTTVPDQLQLTQNTTLFPFIWVPNSNEGTVSKVNTETGDESGRYHTGPGANSNPSRIAIDLQGNCWVGNRDIGTVVKIGLLENGQYNDRNGNGIIETSQDLNGDGSINGDEILPWGADECVLYEVVLVPNVENTFVPGKNLNYSLNPLDTGPRSLAIDIQNNLWAGTYYSKFYYYINGTDGKILKKIDVSPVNHTPYGAVIDANGILWSSGCWNNHVLRLDPDADSFYTIPVGHVIYGIGVDQMNHLFVSGWEQRKFSRINTVTNQVEWTKEGNFQSRGVTVTDDGDVWIANSGENTITRWSNDGKSKIEIKVGTQPTGVSIDTNGKIWVVNLGDRNIHRIDPATNTIDLNKYLGAIHYGYSDMTGRTSVQNANRRGTWKITYDGVVDNATWGIVSWNGYEPETTALSVKVRSSQDQQNWSAWEHARNSYFLRTTPVGRYLQIQVTFNIVAGNISPILYDLTVRLGTDPHSQLHRIQPNPFTPNEDGFNDYVWFNFPELLTEPGSISIFNFRGKKIIEISDDNRWFGKDENGKEQPAGVYLYVVKINGKIINNGTVALVR
ncbi:gliding motility-associated C-terminal domain-containing protein [candidate division KSB1 bacterium]|nr:gliding motility-associated C-terminal domain-containing protein [candidate division KSB1 bacterium]